MANENFAALDVNSLVIVERHELTVNHLIQCQRSIDAALALSKRHEHQVTTESLNLQRMREIYKAEGIKIDSWEIRGHKLRAAYFCDNGDCSVLINKNLPREPRLFSLAHELKHHYADQGKIEGGEIRCGDYNANEVIEIAAEVMSRLSPHP